MQISKHWAEEHAGQPLVPSVERILAVAASTNRLSLVTGPIGCGRTTVLREVASSLADDAILGGGVEILRSVPYLPLARALRLPVDASDAVAAAEFVAAALGPTTTLVLDDLHLCDDATIEVVMMLAGTRSIVVAIADDVPRGRLVLARLQALPHTVEERVMPLDDDEARRVVCSANPQAETALVDATIARAGGNPRALLAYARDPDAPDLRRAVLARLGELDADVRTTLALAGVVGGPISAAALPSALVHSCLASGMFDLVTAGLAPRVRAYAAIAAMSAGETQRQGLHRLAAGLAGDYYVRAVHLEAAGDLEAAGRAADLAVADAGSDDARLEAMALSARVAADEVRAERCLRVAMLASDAGRHALAESLCTLAGDSAKAVAALVGLRAALADGDLARASSQLTGLVDLPARYRVAAELERARLLCLTDPMTALAVAGAVMTDVETPADEARRHAVLGAALLACGTDGWDLELELAADTARAAGLLDVEAAALLNRCAGYLRQGRADDAYVLAGEGRQRCAAAGAWQLHFDLVRLWVTAQPHGELQASVDLATELLDGPVPPHLRREVAAHVLIANLDSGRTGEGGAVHDTVPFDDFLAWALSEAALLSGHRASAMRDATGVAASDPPWPVADFARVTAVRAGAAIDVSFADDAAVHEMTALCSGEDPAAAADHFARAAQAWAGVSMRAHVRCRVAAEIARAQHTTDAAGSLLRLTALAADDDVRRFALALAALDQARRTLGDKSVTFGPIGPRQGLLSRREREIMCAVGDGATSVAIASRLGVATSTVETHVKSAMRKLGAATRTEAAVLAQRQ